MFSSLPPQDLFRFLCLSKKMLIMVCKYCLGKNIRVLFTLVFSYFYFHTLFGKWKDNFHNANFPFLFSFVMNHIFVHVRWSVLQLPHSREFWRFFCGFIALTLVVPNQKSIEILWLKIKNNMKRILHLVCAKSRSPSAVVNRNCIT